MSAASELRSYADQLPVVLSIPNLARKLREAADEIDRLRKIEASALALADIKLAGSSSPFWEAFLALRDALGLESEVVDVV